jgi:hypothetical protein
MLLGSIERLAEQSSCEVPRVPDWFGQQVNPGMQ